MAITVKKKAPMSVKAPTPGDVPSVDATALPQAGTVSNMAPAAFAEKSPSYTGYAICALIAVLMFVVLLFMQWTEWQYFGNAFPAPQKAAPQPAETSTP